MSRSCSLCADQLSRAGVARCKVPHCPAKREIGVARIGKLLLPVLLIAVCFVGGYALLFGPGLPAARGINTEPFIRAEASNAIFSAGDDGVSRQEGGPVVPLTAASLDGPLTLSTPDPRAGSRVQTFDCNGGLSTARQMVCTHWELATIDYNLAIAYRHALESAKNDAALRRGQRAWLNELDRLAEPEAVVRHYRTRLQTLNPGA